MAEIEIAFRNLQILFDTTASEIAADLSKRMWSLLGQADAGTYSFSFATNTMPVFDEFIISRGLLHGLQGLGMDLESVRIMTSDQMMSPRGRPLPFDKKTKKGFSDHFPIEATTQTV